MSNFTQNDVDMLRGLVAAQGPREPHFRAYSDLADRIEREQEQYPDGIEEILDVLWGMLTDVLDFDLSNVDEAAMTLNERKAVALLRKHQRI